MNLQIIDLDKIEEIVEINGEDAYVGRVRRVNQEIIDDERWELLKDKVLFEAIG